MQKSASQDLLRKITFCTAGENVLKLMYIYCSIKTRKGTSTQESLEQMQKGL